MTTAEKYLDNFGIGTECGMARARRPELAKRLLEIHVEALQEPAATA